MKEYTLIFSFSMLKQRIICILGLFTAIFPFFGIPLSWKKAILFIIGIGIFSIGYLLYRERRDYLAKVRNRSASFSEQKPEIHETVSATITPVRRRRSAPKPRMVEEVRETYDVPTEVEEIPQEDEPVVSTSYPYQQRERHSHHE